MKVFAILWVMLAVLIAVIWGLSELVKALDRLGEFYGTLLITALFITLVAGMLTLVYYDDKP
jgi:hypothetical protein